MPASTPDEFWRQLHTLAQTYDELGLTSDERASHLVSQFREIVPQARQELLADIFRLATDLPDLYALIVAAERAADDSVWKRQNGTSKKDRVHERANSSSR